jgi:hypothetical protein
MELALSYCKTFTYYVKSRAVATGPRAQDKRRMQKSSGQDCHEEWTSSQTSSFSILMVLTMVLRGVFEC